MSEVLLVPVCALCRCVLGVGMEITVWHPDHFGAFLAATERPPLENDEIVATCMPCAMQIQRWRNEWRVQ